MNRRRMRRSRSLLRGAGRRVPHCDFAGIRLEIESLRKITVFHPAGSVEEGVYDGRRAENLPPSVPFLREIM